MSWYTEQEEKLAAHVANANTAEELEALARKCCECGCNAFDSDPRSADNLWCAMEKAISKAKELGIEGADAWRE